MTALVIALVWLVLIALILCMFAGAADEPRPPCTGNCNQGRNCSCLTERPENA